MPRKGATVTQADVARVIRAAQAAGLVIVRVIVRQDGVYLETDGALIDGQDRQAQVERVIDL